MHPNRMKGIGVMNLFCNTIFYALKSINTICPKANELLGTLISWQPLANWQRLNNDLGQVILYIKAIVVSVCLCGQCLEDSSNMEVPCGAGL